MIDDYIHQYEGEVRYRLEQIREIIESAMPVGYETSMAYGMPTYRVSGKNIIHFAVAKHHIGIYPSPEGVTYFIDKYPGVKSSKGALQFQHDEEIPLHELKDLVKYRVATVRGDTFPMR